MQEQLIEEFKLFLTEKREKAFNEAMKFDQMIQDSNFIVKALNAEQKPEPVLIAPPVEQKVIETFDEEEVIVAVLNIIHPNTFMIQGVLLSNLQNSNKKFANITISAFNEIMSKEVGYNDNRIKRIMIGDKIYTYTLKNTVIPNTSTLYYNADANGGGVTFNNMGKVALKKVYDYNEKVFTSVDIKNDILKDIPYLLKKHIPLFEKSVSNALGSLAKLGKLQTFGNSSNRSYKLI